MRGRTPNETQIPAAAVVFAAFFLAFYASAGSDSIPDASASPGRWKIDIHVETKGRYALRNISETYRGEFSGKWSWSGFMEDDDGDFLLIHAYSDVRDWTMKEETTGNPSPSFVRKDIPERPSLNISYILRQHNVIDIRFSINGFTVPKHGADVSYSLPLPSSRGDPPRGSIIDYDASVAEGSNRIYLRPSDLRAPSAEKSFEWKWSKQDWLPRKERTVEFSSQHNAKVTVTLESLNETLRPSEASYLRIPRVKHDPFTSRDGCRCKAWKVKLHFSVPQTLRNAADAAGSQDMRRAREDARAEVAVSARKQLVKA